MDNVKVDGGVDVDLNVNLNATVVMDGGVAGHPARASARPGKERFQEGTSTGSSRAEMDNVKVDGGVDVQVHVDVNVNVSR